MNLTDFFEKKIQSYTANGQEAPSFHNEKRLRESLTTFDDFYQVPLADYEWAVKEMLEDRDFLYDTLIRDMHRLGIDLTKRYKNIRWSYQIFLMGLIVSLMSFGSCYLIF